MNHQFNREDLSQLLKNLKVAQSSIKEGSSYFVSKCKDGYIKECVEEWGIVSREFANLGQEQNIICLMYIYNEIINNYREEILLDSFKNELEKLTNILVDSPLNKAKNIAVNIFKKQEQKKILPSDFLQTLSQKIMPQEEEKLPENLPRPPNELIRYIDNQKDYEKFKKLAEESYSKPQHEIKSANEKKAKYCQIYLKSFKDLIEVVDKKHMKCVLDRKLIQQKIDKINEILEYREKNPQYKNKLPKVISYNNQQSNSSLPHPNNNNNASNSGNFSPIENEGWK